MALLLAIILGGLIGRTIKAAAGQVVRALPDGSKVLPMTKDRHGRWVCREL